jgi:hypothetical protein
VRAKGRGRRATALDRGKEGSSIRRIATVITTALVMAACPPVYSLDCGPLDRATCEQEANRIVEIVGHDNPGRTITSIEFLNAARHARVTLDNGQEIGWR